jgi:hypothetical protein
VTDNRGKFEADLKYHPRHIAVLAQPPASAEAWERAKAEVDRIVARLRDGADFAELAREPSRDGSAVAGDDLGWLTRGELQPLFEEPILRLRKGEPELLAQLRQQARDILMQKKIQERLEEWLQGLRQRALIAERL